MSISQVPISNTIFVDYIPAELKEGKVWYVSYHVKHPIAKKLVRKRHRVKPLNSITQRRKLGKTMCSRINERLSEGWNPFFEDKNQKQYKKLLEILEVFIKRKEIEFKDGELRKDTFRTYNSRLRVFKKYLTEKNKSHIFCFELNTILINNFLDFIRYDKGNSAKTRDNYLSFLVTLCNFLTEKNYILNNPTSKISKTNKNRKKRKVIPSEIRNQIFLYWRRKNFRYLTLCLTSFYCLIRRTELTRIRVRNIKLEMRIITIHSEESKNWKTQNVTIPESLVPYLQKHLKNSNPSDFLFSTDRFYPGTRKLNPDRITKEWLKMRKALQISDEIQWYSLKDTGITELLRAGVPLISVRDQARHRDSKETDTYTPIDIINSDSNISDSVVRFTSN